MQFEQRQTVAPQQVQSHVISAKLIMSIQILQYSSLELEQSIAQQAADNPAFEVDELPQCLQCATPLREGRCPTCATSAPTHNHDGDTDWADVYEHSLASGSEDDEFDPMARVGYSATLEETLLGTLSTLLPREEIQIAEALVGNLNTYGWMTASLSEIAADLDMPIERVEAVLAVLQAQEPLGIGARNARECMLIQLRWFRDQGHPQPLAEQVVDRHLRAIAERRFVEIGRDLGTTSTHVRRAWDFIKANLNPYPAHAAIGGPILSGGNARGATALVRPDVIIRRTEHGFEAEVVEGRRYQFQISPSYHSAVGTPKITDAERQHIRKYVSQAQFYIDCVQQRWATLKKIADALIHVQSDFLDKGVRYLVPLTRSELALYVSLHEATISRATNDKYVLLPDGRTISFDDFFNASLRAKDTLRELIDCEDARHPLSDEDLAALLTQRGMPVARRTVAKYRESLKILPSRLR